jgi:hypothetical protein
MDVSSVSSSIQVVPVQVNPFKPQQSQDDNKAANAAAAYQPPSPPPLPPGQGTRVDQLA